MFTEPIPIGKDDVQEPEKLTRIISIRISEAEYQELQRFSRAIGARSIADLARHAIQQTLSKCASDSSHAAAVYMYLLHQSVERLGFELKDCTHLLTELMRTRSPRRQRAARRVNEDADSPIGAIPPRPPSTATEAAQTAQAGSF
ncbi:MAG: hypothetical protein KGN84_16280 [Acidobacteriota bacterium]|nr:hypothetical protein [Acidobacteriota bacterium]